MHQVSRFARRYLQSSGYSDYLKYEIALEPNLPVQPAWKMLEIGSAPGNQLIRYHKKFGYEPFGVEYTPVGVEKNKQVFAEHGIDATHVIHADFFSEEFQEAHREQYDVVYSAGFIEHFTHVRSVVAQHVNLLKPGGRLIIEIPNLKGVNYALSRFFHRESLAVHNLEIMDKHPFQQLFAEQGLEEMFCDYIGVFSLGLQNAKPGSWKQALMPMLRITNALIGLGLRFVMRRNRVESKYTSPYLLYIGKKTETLSKEQHENLDRSCAA